jgi:hypothetical protein
MNILSKEIIKEWGLENLPQKKQEETVNRIGRILYQALLVRALDILSDKEQEELDLLLDKNATTPAEVMLFLKSKIPTFEELVKDERKTLKEDLIVQSI